MSEPALNPAQIEELYELIEKFTGSHQQGSYRKSVYQGNIERILARRRIGWVDYLAKLAVDHSLKTEFLSAVTIHTTSWFRESPHFEILEKQARAWMRERGQGGIPFRVWSCAASTGEEVYSIALILNKLRNELPGFAFEVLGTDIDKLSIAKATRAVYRKEELRQIPKELWSGVLAGSGPTENYIALAPEVRSRTRFGVQSLVELQASSVEEFDAIFCRNVLYYFSGETGRSVVGELARRVAKEGRLYLGHSEGIDGSEYGLRLLGNSCYQRQSGSGATALAPAKDQRELDLLIVDDSKTFQRILGKAVGTQGFKARFAGTIGEAEAALAVRTPDLITLDLNMPDAFGGDWLKDLRKRQVKIPVAVVSEVRLENADELLNILQGGAQDFIPKQAIEKDISVIATHLREIVDNELAKKNHAKQANFASPSTAKKLSFRPEVVLIGASTGGPEALSKILEKLPQPFPPIVLVQHMTPIFLEAFGKRISGISGLELADTRRPQRLRANHIYTALGDYHLQLVRREGTLVVEPLHAEPEHRHRPSVDVLFQSGAETAASCVAFLLTGMGADGAKGLRRIREKSGGKTYCVVQDEKSSVVYGMPREAKRLGAQDIELGLSEIAVFLRSLCGETNSKRSEAS